MSRYAKFLIATREVTDVADHPIQLLDNERGVFDVVLLDLEPLDGTRIGDLVEVRDDPEDRPPYDEVMAQLGEDTHDDEDTGSKPKPDAAS